MYTIGFKFLKMETIAAIVQALMYEGNCYFAYDQFNVLALEKIYELQPEIKMLHHSPNDEILDSDADAWLKCDGELIAFISMIPVTAIVRTYSLYWCSACETVSAEPISCGHDRLLGFDVTPA